MSTNFHCFYKALVPGKGASVEVRLVHECVLHTRQYGKPSRNKTVDMKSSRTMFLVHPLKFFGCPELLRSFVEVRTEQFVTALDAI